MDYSVLGSERRLCEIGVAKLDGVRELLALGVLHDDREGEVVMQCGANVEAVLAAEVRRYTFAGFSMDEDTAAEGADVSGVIVEATIEVLPGVFAGVEGSLTEDSESELGLW